MLQVGMWTCLGRCWIVAVILLATSTRLASQSHIGFLEVVDVENLKGKAQAGDTEAQYDLGLAYTGSEVAGRDDAEAVKWFEKAARQGDVRALRKLGFLYLKRQNSFEAVQCFREAAKTGDATAQFVLGTLYILGREVPRDHLEAVRWLQRAAEKGISTAAYNLGVICADSQNQAEAAKYFRAAAELGLPIAQFKLGFLHAEGRVFPQDYVQAFKWISLAASRAHGETKKKFSKGIRLLSTRMGPTQIARARGLVREWKPKTWEDLAFLKN